MIKRKRMIIDRLPYSFNTYASIKMNKYSNYITGQYEQYVLYSLNPSAKCTLNASIRISEWKSFFKIQDLWPYTIIVKCEIQMKIFSQNLSSFIAYSIRFILPAEQSDISPVFR